MDQHFAFEAGGGFVHGGRQRHGGRLVLLHAEVHARWLSADPAGGLSAFRACRSGGDGLPLLSQRGGEVVVFERAGEFDLHELPQPSVEGRPAPGLGARERADWEADSLGANPQGA